MSEPLRDTRPPAGPRPSCRTPGCHNLPVNGDLTDWCAEHIDAPPAVVPALRSEEPTMSEPLREALDRIDRLPGHLPDCPCPLHQVVNEARAALGRASAYAAAAEQVKRLAASPEGLDVERLAAAHAAIDGNDDHPDWMVLFDWHRAEYDKDKTRLAFAAILREYARLATQGEPDTRTDVR